MFDVRHHIVGYLTYELPVGKGKKYLGEGGVASYILGGWQINTIVTAQTGRHHSAECARYQPVGRQSRFASGLHWRCALRRFR